MNTLWQRYAAWLGARVARERAIVAAALVGGIAFLGYSYAIEPALLRARAAEKTLLTLPSETLVLQAQTQQITAQAQDPDAPQRAELARIAADSAEQSQRFRVVERSMISPANMADLLESLLKRTHGLELVSLRTLAPVPLLSEGATKAAEAGAKPVDVASTPAAGQLFKHGMELRVAGNYLDLLAYLKQMEVESPNLLWGRLDLKTEQYPRSVMTLTVYSLSMDTSWLAL